ncbi:hypothetical protein PR001_g18837 [Phytophthora rubi]|uniref:Uncharacterized protein n=2 Tax=Phytophthora rubi TaxID=129364 RepID=A0A6A3K6A6_9STRA|nr:hypothetical protein PR001_g18837 [Phytophthora rubi]
MNALVTDEEMTKAILQGVVDSHRNVARRALAAQAPPFHRQYTRLTSSFLFAMQGCGYSQYQAHSPHHQLSGELPKLYYKSLDHGTNGGSFNGPACMNSSST